MLPQSSEKFKLKGAKKEAEQASNEQVSLESIPQIQSHEDLEKDLRAMSLRNRPILYAKIALIFFIMIVHFLYTRKFSSPRKSVECLSDSVFQLTEQVNERLNTDPLLLRILQITSSMAVDFADLSVLITYNLRGVTLAFPIQVGLFYIGRGIVQGTFLFSHPKGTIWTHPGIPSLTVPYGKMSDYYFSGHCGFMAMMALENYKLGNKKNSIALFLLLPYVAFVLVASRVHYSIDIPIGVMFGLYTHYWAHQYIDYFHLVLRWLFNRWLWKRIPFFSEV